MPLIFDIVKLVIKQKNKISPPHVGHVVKETDDKIVVFGYYDHRFVIPKSDIVAAGRNVIVGIDFPELLKHKADRNAPLPTGEPIDKLAEEEKL